AGLRGAHHVPALQHDRDCLGLDRRRVDIALIGQGAQDFRRQAEILKTYGVPDRFYRAGVRVGHGFYEPAIDQTAGRQMGTLRGAGVLQPVISKLTFLPRGQSCAGMRLRSVITEPYKTTLYYTPRREIPGFIAPKHD